MVGSIRRGRLRAFGHGERHDCRAPQWGPSTLDGEGPRDHHGWTVDVQQDSRVRSPEVRERVAVPSPSVPSATPCCPAARGGRPAAGNSVGRRLPSQRTGGDAHGRPPRARGSGRCVALTCRPSSCGVSVGVLRCQRAATEERRFLCWTHKGAGGGNRTHDLTITSRLRYQLRHTGTVPDPPNPVPPSVYGCFRRSPASHHRSDRQTPAWWRRWDLLWWVA